MAEAEKQEVIGAWQPITPGGVAAFSKASFARLFSFQLGFAIFNAVAFAWFLQTSWFPVIRSAIERLPASGEISNGSLSPQPSPVLLAYNSDLAFVVDLQHTGGARVPADVLIEFGLKDVRFYSLIGFIELEYPAGWRIALNRTETGPWWGAWKPPALWLAVLSCIACLVIGWSVIAAVYSMAVWLIAFFANRNANLMQSWRLAAAALMPASLVLWLGIVLYGSGALSLLGLLLMMAGHLVVGWIYIFVAPLTLARSTSAPVKGNPFAPKP